MIITDLVLECFLKFKDMLVVILHPKLPLRLQSCLLEAHLLLKEPQILLFHFEISSHRLTVIKRNEFRVVHGPLIGILVC